MNVPLEPDTRAGHPDLPDDATEPDEPGVRDEDPRVVRERRLLAEAITAGTLPAVTTDELDDRDGPYQRGGDDRERWYRENRPPHHG